MTFQEIKSIITILHNASTPCIPLFEFIENEWQIQENELCYERLGDDDWNYSAELFEGAVDKGEYTVVNVMLCTGVHVTMYFDNAKRIGE